MAYRRSSRSSGRRSYAKPARRTYRSRSGSTRGRRTSTGRTRGRSAGLRTIRIVLEQPAANAVARPPIGLTEAPKPRKAVF